MLQWCKYSLSQLLKRILKLLELDGIAMADIAYSFWIVFELFDNKQGNKSFI